MEEHDPSGGHEPAPHLPVTPAAGLGVVAVDEHQIHRLAPARGRRCAALDVPHHPRARAAPTLRAADDPARGALHRRPAGQQGRAGAEGVDEVQGGMARQGVDEDDRRGALVDADLDRGAPVARELREQRGLGRAVHGPRRHESAADGEGAKADRIPQSVGGEPAHHLGQRHAPILPERTQGGGRGQSGQVARGRWRTQNAALRRRSRRIRSGARLRTPWIRVPSTT